MLQANDLQFVSKEMDQLFVICSVDKKTSEKIYGENLYGRLVLYTRTDADFELKLHNSYKPYVGESSVAWVAEQLSTLPEDTLKKFHMTRISFG